MIRQFCNRLAFVISVALLASCANTYDLQSYQRLDLSQKSVTVSAGGSGLAGKLKQAMSSDGWALVVKRGPTVTEGTLGAKTRLEQYETQNARYQLLVRSNTFDTCLVTQSPAMNFDISLIDNVNGAEVFTMSGTGCESIIVSKFTRLIRNQSLD